MRCPLSRTESCESIPERHIGNGRCQPYLAPLASARLASCHVLMPWQVRRLRGVVAGVGVGVDKGRERGAVGAGLPEEQLGAGRERRGIDQVIARSQAKRWVLVSQLRPSCCITPSQLARRVSDIVSSRSVDRRRRGFGQGRCPGRRDRRRHRPSAAPAWASREPPHAAQTRRGVNRIRRQPV